MLDYYYTYPDNPIPTPTSQLPTSLIIEMIDYTKGGGRIDDLDPGTTREMILDRLNLELEIRSMEGRL